MRAAHSNVKVSVGPLVSFTCDLITPTMSASSKAGKAAGKVQTKYACPTCAEADETSLVNQRYVCQNKPDHGPFETGSLSKAMEVADGTYKVIGSAAEVDAVRKDHGDKAKKVINFTAHPADDVLNSTLPGEKCWVVRPTTAGDPAFQALLAVTTESSRIELDGPDVVLLAPAVLGSTERLVRAERWGEQILVREVLWPSELKEGLALNDTPPDPRLIAPVRKFVETYTVEFDPTAYNDTTNDRLRQFGLARIGDDGVVVAMPDSVGVTQEATVDDLMAALEAVVAAA